MFGLKRVLFFGVVVAAGIAATYVYSGDGWLRQQIAGLFSGPASQGERQAAAPTGEAEPSGPELAASDAERPEPEAKTGQAAKAPRPPAFDVVRVQDSGEMVVAGVAPPGWTVRIHTQKGTVGTTEAGFDGAWALLPEPPLPAGDHSLSLTALAPDGSRSVDSTERVAVSVSAGGASAVVALSDSNEPTRILQSGAENASEEPDTPASETPKSVAFSAVDYDDEQQTGRLHMSGRAKPGGRIALYLDNRFIGSTKANEDGEWQFSITDILDAESHVLRADHVDMDKGEVLSRAEVPFDPDGVAMASADRDDPTTALAAAQGTGDTPQEERLSETLSGQTSGDGDGGPGSADAGSDGAKEREAIVVRSGDTLWHIAERHYGSGVRYTKIFRNNRDQIRSPHRIYPGQQFELPQ